MTETGPGRLSEHVPVRFSGDLAAAAKRLARQDGMSVSAWVRRIVDREIAARSGKCPTCGHAEPQAGNPATPDERG